MHARMSGNECRHAACVTWHRGNMKQCGARRLPSMEQQPVLATLLQRYNVHRMHTSTDTTGSAPGGCCSRMLSGLMSAWTSPQLCRKATDTWAEQEEARAMPSAGAAQPRRPLQLHHRSTPATPPTLTRPPYSPAADAPLCAAGPAPLRPAGARTRQSSPAARGRGALRQGAEVGWSGVGGRLPEQRMQRGTRDGREARVLLFLFSFVVVRPRSPPPPTHPPTRALAHDHAEVSPPSTKVPSRHTLPPSTHTPPPTRTRAHTQRGVPVTRQK